MKFTYFFLAFLFLFIGCVSKLKKTEIIEALIIDLNLTNGLYIVVKLENSVEMIHIDKECKIKDNLIGSSTKILKNTYSNKYIEYLKYFDKNEYCN